MKPSNKITRLRKHIFVTLILLLGFFGIPHFILHSKSFQNWGLEQINALSDWEVHWDNMNIKLLLLNFSGRGLSLRNKTKGHTFEAQKFVLKISPWRLLAGQVAITKLIFDSPRIEIGSIHNIETEKRSLPLLDLKHLLLLQNLRVNDLTLINPTVVLPNKKIWYAGKITSNLIPTFSGKMEWGIVGEIVTHRSNPDMPILAQKIRTKVTTDLKKWSALPPYVEELEGIVSFQEAQIGPAFFNRFLGDLTYKDKTLSLQRLDIQSGEHSLKGSLEANLKTEQFAVTLEALKPIQIPNFGSQESPVFTTAGELTGKIHLEGEYFNPKKLMGKGTIDLNHAWKSDPDFPAKAALNFIVNEGTIQIEEGTLSSEDQSINLNGNVALFPPNMKLSFKTQNFPLERIFKKFFNPHFHPIVGGAEVDGKLTGWKENIHLVVGGKVHEAKYYTLQVQEIEPQFDLTYNTLHLKGTLIPRGTPTGTTDLTVHYGPKRGNEPRPKKINLIAILNYHPLEDLLPDKGLSGLASGGFQMEGTPENPRGRGSLQVAQGAVFGKPIDIKKALFTLDNQHHLTVHSVAWDFQSLDPVFFQNPLHIDIDSNLVKIHGTPLDNLDVQIRYRNDEKNVYLDHLRYRDKENPDWTSSFSGKWSLDGEHSIQGKGILDLTEIQRLVVFIREGKGPVQFNLHLTGTQKEPNLSGTLEFRKNVLALKNIPYSFESLEGKLQFTPEKITISSLKGIANYGNFALSGSLDYQGFRPTHYRLDFQANQLPFRNPERTLRMEFDGNLSLKGPATNPTLSGDITLLDAKYTKNFNLIDKLSGREDLTPEIRKALWTGPPIKLQLKVTSAGEMEIDNNIAKIILSGNLLLKGNYPNPNVFGTIQVNEGEIHYLGFDFEITRGFMEFKGPYNTPYLEVQGERDVDIYHLSLLLHGETDNLILDLSGTSQETGPLDQKDVVSLLTFGVTTKEREAFRSLEGQLASTLVTGQLSSAVSRPLARAARLDVLRLETIPEQGEQISRFHIGKQFTDRFSTHFSSDINTEEAIQRLQAEYWLTDTFLFKGAQSSDNKFELDFGLRFRTR